MRLLQLRFYPRARPERSLSVVRASRRAPDDRSVDRAGRGAGVACRRACGRTRRKRDCRKPSSTSDACRRGAPLEHAFRIRNDGSAPLRIERVALTPPLRMAGMRAQIAPGAETQVRIHLDPAALAGRYDGRVILFTNDPAAPEITLRIGGEVVPAIELSPLPAVFLAGPRGKGAVATIDIVNRRGTAARTWRRAPRNRPLHEPDRDDRSRPALSNDGRP